MWTPQKVAIEASTRASSMQTKPLRSMLPPTAPYPSYPTPPIPSAAIFGTISWGNLSRAQKSSIRGATSGLHKGAHALDERAVAIGKKSSDLVEVSIGGRGRVFRAASRALDGQRTASLRVLVDNYFLLSTAP